MGLGIGIGVLFLVLIFNFILLFILLPILPLLFVAFRILTNPNQKNRKVRKKVKSSSDSWVKGLEGENIVWNYLNTLPEGYYVFHDVTLPEKKGNIDDVVVGPNGLFLIEVKNYSGEYRIEENEWYYYNDEANNFVKAWFNPIPQLMGNTLDLKNFLETNGVSSSEMSIIPIVVLIRLNFSIVKNPFDYTLLNADNLLKFIFSVPNQENKKELENVTEELKSYCTRYSY